MVYQSVLRKKRQLIEKGSFNCSDSFYFSDTIGEGSGGKVYLAEHINTGQQVAIKTESGNKERLHHNLNKEIDILRLIKHENVVTLLGVFEFSEEKHLVMDYMDGGDLLDDLYKKKRPHSEPRAREIVAGILSAINFCHTRVGVVHRDLKPENILLDKRGGVKITDFGLSTRLLETSSYLTTFC